MALSATIYNFTIGLSDVDCAVFDLSVTDRHLFLSIGGTTLSGEIERLRLDA